MLFFDFSGSLWVEKSIDVDGTIFLIHQEKMKRKLQSTVNANKIIFSNPNFDRISFDLFCIIGNGFVEIKPKYDGYYVFFQIKTRFLFKLFSFIFAVPLFFIFLFSKNSFILNIFISQYLWIVAGNLIVTKFRYKRFLKRLLLFK